MISARLRHGSAWSDARILDISTRGLCVHAEQPPPRGTYVEICKGPHRIVARVIWARDERFGAQAQGRLAVDSITMGIEPPAPAAGGAAERRSRSRQPSASERHERSRRRSRAIQFLCILGFGVVAGIIAFDSVKGALSRPLATVAAQLGGND